MKRVIFFLFLFFTASISAQSVFVSDSSSTCFFGEEFLLNGTLNGRNVYSFADFDIEWTGTQWQIRAGGNVFLSTEANSSPNPPDDESAAANGTPWLSGPACPSEGGFSITGSGTQTEIDNTSSTQVLQSSAFKIFPNPVTDQLFIQHPIQGKLWLRNIHGRIVADFQHHTTVIDISNLPSGTYFIQQMTEKGQLISQRFLKL